jgi:lipid-A-disaccharide synthase-like uncharacterized protein
MQLLCMVCMVSFALLGATTNCFIWTTLLCQTLFSQDPIFLVSQGLPALRYLWRLTLYYEAASCAQVMVLQICCVDTGGFSYRRRAYLFF